MPSSISTLPCSQTISTRSGGISTVGTVQALEMCHIAPGAVPPGDQRLGAERVARPAERQHRLQLAAGDPQRQVDVVHHRHQHRVDVRVAHRVGVVAVVPPGHRQDRAELARLRDRHRPPVGRGEAEDMAGEDEGLAPRLGGDQRLGVGGREPHRLLEEHGDVALERGGGDGDMGMAGGRHDQAVGPHRIEHRDRVGEGLPRAERGDRRVASRPRSDRRRRQSRHRPGGRASPRCSRPKAPAPATAIFSLSCGIDPLETGGGVDSKLTYQ